MADDLPETGAVFTFGKSHFADNEPSHFFIKNDPIVAISCGDEHSAVICQNGRVFVFGENAWGQLGLGHKDEVTRPSCVKWLKPHRAIFVACGRAHTVFVTDTHAVYTVGCNEEGQLGTGDNESHTVPQYVEIECEDIIIKQVSAGSNHTAILTETGKVFMCGSNSEGQLGLGEETRNALKFTELNFMEKIAFVECGYYHTVFLTQDGVVFVTGENEGQKLGISRNPIIYVPVELPMATPIKSVCCGANHTFLLSMDETKVLGFGSNDKGQLGLPKIVENVTEPKEIEIDKIFDGYQLKLVACGAMHTAFLTDNGLLYTCGESRHNKLCLDQTNESSADFEMPNQYLPKRVNAMNGFTVDNVACGGCHTLLTATKTAGSDNEVNPVNEHARNMTLTELPPLQKVPVSAMNVNNSENQNENESKINDDVLNNGNDEEASSMNSLAGNASNSHRPSLELDNDCPNNETISPSAPDIELDTLKQSLGETGTKITNELQKNAAIQIENINENIKEKIEVVEDTIEKVKEDIDCKICDSRKVLTDDGENESHMPSDTPILPELLEVPEINKISLNNDEQNSEYSLKSENETIPCESAKSSPNERISAKTQAVMPIVRSGDSIDMDNPNENVVVSKTAEKGRLAQFFQSIKDKESSCIGKGKVIEEKIEENMHKTITGAEETIHEIEHTVVTEVRNQTNSRTCTIL